jgi:sensor histidine kinase YesM
MRIFSNKAYWTLQICWWLFTTFILRQPSTKYFDDWNIKLSYLLLNFIVGIGFTHAYSILFHKRFKDNDFTFVYPIVGAIFTGLAFFLIDYYFGFQRYRKPSQGIPLEAWDYYQFFFEAIRHVILWFLVYHLLITTRIAAQNELNLTHAKMALQTAELENLKNQLNPHFLFNAINSIKALTISEPQSARNALTELSQLLRTSLSMGGEQLVALEMELGLVTDYLSLEKIRYENRLNYSFDIAKNTLNFKLPPMSLQLLVENAIKHGISKTKNGGTIFIKTTLIDNIFNLTVTNSGKLNENYSPVGVGLKNLERRLQINYQEKANFSVTENDGQVHASIIVIMR